MLLRTPVGEIEKPKGKIEANNSNERKTTWNGKRRAESERSKLMMCVLGGLKGRKGGGSEESVGRAEGGHREESFSYT